jgi:hypothetical protein
VPLFLILTSGSSNYPALSPFTNVFLFGPNVSPVQAQNISIEIFEQLHLEK